MSGGAAATLRAIALLVPLSQRQPSFQNSRFQVENIRLQFPHLTPALNDRGIKAHYRQGECGQDCVDVVAATSPISEDFRQFGQHLRRWGVFSAGVDTEKVDQGHRILLALHGLGTRYVADVSVFRRWLQRRQWARRAGVILRPSGTTDTHGGEA